MEFTLFLKFATLREVYHPLEGVLSCSSKHILSNLSMGFLALKSKTLSFISPLQNQTRFLILAMGRVDLQIERPTISHSSITGSKITVY